MKKNVYEIVTDKIIKQMENGIIPWEKPWTGCGNGAYNRISGKPYSLLNQMMLWRPGEYATMKQWNELGGKIKKGEHAEGEKREKIVPMLRYYNVFHVDQVEGVEPLTKEERENARTFDPIAEAERLSAEYVVSEGIVIDFMVGDRACYSPLLDRVKMPRIDQFNGQSEYYSVLFHELTHSTGHKKRLDRLNGARFGSVDYASEELVAEMGAASILCQLGIETDKSLRNSAAYIQSWIKTLRNDPKMVVIAASKAEKAVEYMKSAANGEKIEKPIRRRRTERAPRVITAELEQIKRYILDFDLTITKTAENMGVAPSTVRRWIAESELIDPELYADLSSRLDARKREKTRAARSKMFAA